MSNQLITVALFAAIFLIAVSFTKRPKKALRFQRGDEFGGGAIYRGKSNALQKKMTTKRGGN